METIRTYLETMFKPFPQNDEIFRIKAELLSTMEDKYNELKAEGKSENEAIGIVISEFGNIDELAEALELEIQSNNTKNDIPTLKLDDVQEFFGIRKKYALRTAIGAGIILVGLAWLLWALAVSFNPWDKSFLTYLIIGLAGLFISTVTAVWLILPCSVKLNKFSYLIHEFNLPASVNVYAEAENSKFSKKKIKLIVTGVIICLLAVLVLLVVFSIAYSSPDFVQILFFGLGITLMVITAAVIPLTYMGVIQQGYDIVLHPINYPKPNSKGYRIINAIAPVFWCLVIAAYFLWSFLGGAWKTSWIILPVSALIFGGIAGCVEVAYSSKNK